MSSRRIHENYHKNTTSQKKVIDDKNFTYRLLLKVLNKKISSGKLKVLDIGCGAGTICFYLANKGHKVTGIDISQKAVNECRTSAKRLGIKNVDFIRLDFPKENLRNKKYDIVILTEVIEHIENDNLALKEILKLLKSNGLLILSTPSIDAPLNRLGLTKEFDNRVGHLRRYSLLNLKKLLRTSSFRIEEIERTEGIIRNFLFVNPFAGKLVRIINHFGSDFVTYIDNVSLKLFGESNYIIVAQKQSKQRPQTS